MKHITVVQNPLVTHALSVLRDKNTAIDTYRYYSDQLCQILVGESLSGLPLKKVPIHTPVSEMSAEQLDARDIVIVPILRAGIAMLASTMAALPKARVGFIGLERDEKTAIAREYYCKLPEITADTLVLVIDPMLATGGSILHLLQRLAKTPAKEVRVISVISAPEGIENVTTAFPQIQIYTAAIDERLNDQKYIVPGLGDYGDRYFGTE